MTFSILVRTGETLGVGVVSGSVGVGCRVPWIKKGVGAIATQGYTRTAYGRGGLELLDQGEDPESALKKLRERDPTPDKRQVAILDSRGKYSIFTGGSCPDEKGAEIKKNCVCIGNYLKTNETLSKMASSFLESDESPLRRILKAMEAGRDAGGDKRGNRTAAIVVKGSENLKISVDESKSPVRDLKNKLSPEF